MKKIYSFIKFLCFLTCITIVTSHNAKAQSTNVVYQGPATAPTCSYNAVSGGAGAYWSIPVTNGVSYSFYWTYSGCGDLNNYSLGSTSFGSGANSAANPELETAGGLILNTGLIGFDETNTTWCGGSSVLYYKITTPTVTAGGTTAATVCAGSHNYTIPSGYGTDVGSISWSTSGNGTFTNGTTTTPTYNFGSADTTGNNTITLTMTANNGGCTASQNFSLTIDKSPTATQGGTTTGAVCVTSPTYTIPAGYASSAIGTISWSSSGDGTFTNGSTTTPTYHLGANDISFGGNVTLTMSVSNGVCANSTAPFVLTINKVPTAVAGGLSLDTACASANSYHIPAGYTATNGTISWSTSGDGTFTSGANTTTPVYTFGTNDKANGGAVTLTMTVSNAGCTAASTTFTLIIKKTPTATAGGTSTAEVCANTNSYTIPAGYTATNGTIAWTSNGDGTFTNGTTTSPTYTFGTNDKANGGTVTLTMTVSNGAACAPGATATFGLTIDKVPTTATVGANQNICGSLSSSSLGGNSASVGTGVWSQVSGPGSTLFNPSSASNAASASAGAYGTYVYAWTISNGVCPASSAKDTVSYYATPTTATVGANQNICGSFVSNSLGGNTPTAGTGAWSQVSGPSTATFSNATSGSSTATVTAYGTYVYQWTISNGNCTPSSATITVNYYATPTTATAAGTLDTCGALISPPLGGNTPAIGTGAWSQISGPGATFFSAVNSGSSTAAVASAGTYVFAWTITNGTCTSVAYDTVNYYNTPTVATAGGTQNICGTLTSGGLGGNVPTAGTGTGLWTQTGGPGTTTFSPSASFNNATATATVAGSYTYTWTISNGTCTPSSASTTVNFISTPTGGTIANASYCSSAGTGTVSVTGVSNANQYVWSLPAGLSGSSTTSTITVGGTVPGTYTVTVTPQDAAFGVTCTGSPVTGIVTILSQPVIDSVNAGSLSCFGGSNDTIRVYATTGNGNLFYSIDGGTTFTNTTGVFPNLGAGSYTIEVKDDSTCAAVYGANPVKVLPPAQLLLSIASFSNVLCHGDSTGYIDLSATGGTGAITFAWNNGATSQNINHLAAGNFSVTATDANGCTAFISQAITEPTALTDSISATNISCYGANNATATFIVNGGVPPYKYLWSNGDTSQTITNLNGAVYFVTATDNNGCKAVASVNIVNPQPVAVTLNVTNVTCFGAANGEIVANATGGTGSYTYTWSPAVSTTSTVTGAGPGTYTLTVSDVNNCSAVDSATITQPLTGLSATSVVTPVGCAGDSNGSINLLASGGVGGYVYNWSSGQNIQIISGLGAGSYTGTVTDANGCMASVTDVLQSPAVLTSSLTTANVTCFGANNGTASVSVSGGVAPYTLLWNNFDTAFILTNLAAGHYGVIITDSYGCKQIDTITITEPQPLAATVTVRNVGCAGGNTGSVVVNVTGGTPNYSYAWSPVASSTDSVSGVGAGTYTVTVTDANGCTLTASGTVTQLASTLSAVSVVNNITCNNANNGEITVLPSGGSGGYTYSWTGTAQTTSTVTGLGAGTYTVTVTDGNGCTVSLSNTLTNPSAITSNVTGTNVTCAGAANGSATLTVSGGTPGYTFLWSNFDTSQNLSNIGGGLYRVIITDANGCKAYDSIIVTEPQPLAATVTVRNVGCAGGNTGSVVVNVTGGTPNYSYAWSPVASSTDSVSGVGAGTYTVTVTDANGCTITASGTVTQLASTLSAVSIVDSITCNNANNGKITVLPSGGSGGYTYSWTGTAQTTSTVTGLGAGTYTVTVTDGNGCTTSLSNTLTNPSVITSSITGTNVTCAGAANGSATLTVSGGTPGYTFLWSNFDTSQNLSNIGGGLYRVIITDANGCKAYDSIIVTEPQPLVATVTVNNVGCFGSNTGSVVVNVTGGTPNYSYAWSPVASSTDSVSGVGAGTYTVTVTDANGCTLTASGTVTQPTSALSAVATVTGITCNNANNGSITVLASGGSGGYTYSWTGTAQTTSTVTGLGAGTYTVTVTDGNGCTTSLSNTLTNPSVITSNITGTNVTCAGAANGSATLTVSGGTPGYTFLWSNFDTSQNLSNIGGGLYRVIITDANGCKAYDSIIITEPQPLATTVTVRNVGCFGSNTGSVVVNVTGGTPNYSYAWSPVASSTDSVSGVGAGTYTVTVTDANGCTITASGTVTQPATAIAAVSTVSNITCNNANNGSITVLASGGSGGYTYSWTGTAQTTSTVTGLGAGTYTVTVTDGNGCTVSLTNTLTNPTAITSSVTGTNVTCAGAANGSATLTVSGGTPGYTFLWSNGSATQNADSLSGGWYYVVITDSNGCQSRDSVRIFEPQPLVVTDSISPVLCNNGSTGSIILTVTGGNGSYTYTWSPAGPNSPNNTGLAAGTYSVTVADVKGCSATLSATLTNPAPLTVSHVFTAPRCNGDVNGSIDLFVSGGTQQYSYNWSPVQNNAPDISNLAAGVYLVTVTDAHGCTITDSINVTQPNPMYVSGIQKNVSCHNLNDGYILPTAYGGTTPYSYQWYLGADTFAPVGPITQNITQLAGGTYYLIVTDNNGCRVPFTRTITNPDSLIISLTATNLKCAGIDSGAVAVIVTGGTHPYQYLWSNFVTDSFQTAIAAGNYGVVVTDSNGCHQEQNINVTQPQPIVVTAVVTDPTCNAGTNGSAALTVQGGVPQYTYLWNTTPVQTTGTATNLAAGSYSVTITDANGCKQTDSVALGQPDALYVNTAVTAPTCSGGDNGFVSLDARGGTAPYLYNWSTTPVQTGNVASGLTGGVYYATITDNKGCTLLDTAIVVAPQPIVVSIAAGSSTCANAAGGVVVVDVTGGFAPYTYGIGTITQPGDTFRGLTVGTYTAVVTDANGCVGSAPVTIQPLGTLVDTLTATPNVILAGETVQLYAHAVSDTTITSYIWYPADSLNFSNCGGNTTDCDSPTVRPTRTGDYIVTVVNARGCSVTDTVRINVSDHPSVFIPTGFTPNGDHLNDRFEFDILGASTINVQIWDRWGELVYSNPAQPNGINGSNGWDGTFRGQRVAYDTYTYQFVVTYFDNHTETIAGTVVVIR